MLYNVNTQRNSVAASNARRSPFSADYQAYDTFRTRRSVTAVAFFTRSGALWLRFFVFIDFKFINYQKTIDIFLFDKYNYCIGVLDRNTFFVRLIMRNYSCKITAWLLTIIIVFSAFVTSCADTGEEEAQTTDTPAAAATDPMTDELTEADTTPVFNEANYGGENFVVISRSPTASSYPAFYIGTEEPTDVMSSAVYTRNINTEEKYGIKIEQLVSDKINSSVQNGVSSGTMDFDVVLNQRESLASLATSGYLYNFNDLGIDFSNPWWDANCAEGYEIDGKLFIMANDTSVSNLAGARFFYFNKNLIKNYQLTSPYTYIQDNNWTLDNFLALVNSVYADDGDQVRTGNDTYGLLMETGATNGNAIHMLVGCGVKFSEKDSNGMLTVDLDIEKIDNIFSKLSTVLKGETCMTYSDASDGAEYSEFGNKYNYCRNLFAQDHFLFVQANMGVSNQMSDMQGDGYGITPNPKYSSDQESYYHKMDKLSNIWGVPNSDALDFEMIANVMDYWAYESSLTVMPAYYEITIKTRRINDPYDTVMLDLIKSTIVYDISEVFGIDVTDALWTGYSNNSLASAWATQSKAVKRQITTLNDNIDKLG